MTCIFLAASVGSYFSHDPEKLEEQATGYKESSKGRPGNNYHNVNEKFSQVANVAIVNVRK
jgi:hypothetical protein